MPKTNKNPGSPRPFLHKLVVLIALIPLWCAGASTARGATVTITNSVHIKPSDKWNPHFWLGNSDEPVPPADYRPDDKHRVRKWYFRNPTHNFNYYVIGIADKTFRRSGRCPQAVFNPHEGWNWAVCKYRFLRLPFVSYQHKSFKCYADWRERGNFGIELKLHSAREGLQAKEDKRVPISPSARASL